MGSTIDRLLVTGASGQIGSELVPYLREIYGKEDVVASDIRKTELAETGPFEVLDVTDRPKLENMVKDHKIDTIIHLAALLSASGELRPNVAWNINVNGLYNVLEVARELRLARVFHPSSIAVFGPESPRENTPQECPLRPRTMYGITKVTGELLGNYYYNKFGVDVRGARFPGVISNKTPPTGGTTDYAVEIFYDAVKYGKYNCFLREDTYLPMMYMPDLLNGTAMFLEADISRLKHHADFNMAALSFCPRELSGEIKKHLSDFQITYNPDYRQAIADSWPKSIDDSAARTEWGWKHEYGLPAMVKDMLEVLTRRKESGKL